MPLPRVRFTVRRMMVAVAAVAILLGAALTLRGRQRWFRELRREHQTRALLEFEVPLKNGTIPRERRGHAIRLRDWHWRLVEKYRRATRYPFLPVAPDPPEPE